MNLKMSPVLRRYISELQKNIPFTVIPRRNKRSLNCVEIVLEDGFSEDISGKLNSKPEAERCGFWFMIRPLTRGRKQAYHHKQVYQLYLSPVHHVKRHKHQLLAITAAGFTPIQEDTARQRRTVSVVAQAPPVTELHKAEGMTIITPCERGFVFLPTIAGRKDLQAHTVLF